MGSTHFISARLPALLTLAMLGLAGCSGPELLQNLGLTRNTPNEFVVTTRAPLQMPPPSFEIRPPAPGAKRPQEQSERDLAEEALVPETALAPGSSQPSSGQAAIVKLAGPNPPSGIRAKVNQETALDRPAETLTDQLMFWRSPPPVGTVVDATRESQRLRQNAALGQSPEAGNTPTVQPKRSSFLGSLNPF